MIRSASVWHFGVGGSNGRPKYRLTIDQHPLAHQPACQTKPAIARPFEPPTPKCQTDAERIMARLAQTPTREDLWRAVLLGMLGGACLTQLLALLFR